LHQLGLARHYIDCVVVGVAQVFDPRQKIRARLNRLADFDAPQSLHQNPNVPVRVLEHLEDSRSTTAFVEIVPLGRFLIGRALCDRSDDLVTDQGLFDESEGGFARNQQRHDRGGKHDDAAKWQDRQLIRDRDILDRLFEGKPVRLFDIFDFGFFGTEFFVVREGFIARHCPLPPLPFNFTIQTWTQGRWHRTLKRRAVGRSWRV